MTADDHSTGSAPTAGDGQDKKPLIEYPALYTFKVMGRQAPDFANHVRGLFDQLMGSTLAPEAIVEHPSSKGTYVSLSVSVRLVSEEQRRSVYERLQQDPRIVYYL